jgi:iron complex transport system permease protein
VRLVRWGVLLLGTLLVLALAPTIGSTQHEIGELWQVVRGGHDVDPAVAQILELRLARVALGFLVGGILAAAGAAFQTLLGNPLATPFTVGVAAAGSFGAFLAVAVPGVAQLAVLSSLPVQALLWACLDLGVLYLLARRGRWSSNSLILAGVTMNFLFAAGTMMLRLLTDPYRLQAMDRWLMGSLAAVGWQPARIVLLLAGLPLLALVLAAPALDQLALGDGVAHGRGVPVARTRLAILVLGVWLTGSCVSQVGPIAFVGLLVPHGVRLSLGVSHRLVLPASVLAGGSFLVVCDTIARSLPLLGPGAEAPVGLITALVGGPVFLALLARRSEPQRL